MVVHHKNIKQKINMFVLHRAPSLIGPSSPSLIGPSLTEPSTAPSTAPSNDILNIHIIINLCCKTDVNIKT